MTKKQIYKDTISSKTGRYEIRITNRPKEVFPDTKFITFLVQAFPSPVSLPPRRPNPRIMCFASPPPALSS